MSKSTGKMANRAHLYHLYHQRYDEPGVVIPLHPEDRVTEAVEAQAKVEPVVEDAPLNFSGESDESLLELMQDRFYGLDKHPIFQKLFGKRYARRRHWAYDALKVRIDRLERELEIGPYRAINKEFEEFFANLEREKAAEEEKKRQADLDKQIEVIHLAIDRIIKEDADRFKYYDLGSCVNRAVQTVHGRVHQNWHFGSAPSQPWDFLNQVLSGLPLALAQEIKMEYAKAEKQRMNYLASRLMTETEHIGF